MARISPSANFQAPVLEDHEGYNATLKDFDWVTSSEQYGGEKRLQLDWQIEGESYSIRDWVGLRLGKQQSGQVSKLRALLNAIAGKPEATEIAWFDDETTEWSYDGTTAYGKLEPDACEVIVRGTSMAKEDGTSRFSVKVYQPKKATAKRQLATVGAASKPVAGAPGTPLTTDDGEEVPF